MRDLIRNYRMAIKRQKDTDSDTASQPLLSSSNSYSSSRDLHTPIFFKGYNTESSDFDSSTGSLMIPTGYIKPVSKLTKYYTNNGNFVNKKSVLYGKQQILSTNQNKIEMVRSPNGNSGFFQDRNSYLKYNQNANSSSPLSSFSEYHIIGNEEVPRTHSSLVTIFAIWNTSVGTSLLSMAWGVSKTGLFPAIFINISLAALCLYTSYVLLQINDKHSLIGQKGEVCDLCRQLIGRWAEVLAKIFSIVVLIGAEIVYWILLSNFLYNSVNFIYGSFFIPQDGLEEYHYQQQQSVICPKEILINSTGLTFSNESIPFGSNGTTIFTRIGRFEQFWDLYSTVPILLALIMFPLLNWKSPTFFTKFNSLGTLSVLYLIVFVAIKASQWHINIPDWTMEMNLKSTFCALSGMLSMSYFIHNIIISLMRNNRDQRNNGRDLTIAFCLITFTYLFIGTMFYMAFPLAKYCIEDNILNNFSKFDVLSIIGRVLLMFQVFTVFPLLAYMLRNDIFSNINMLLKRRPFCPSDGYSYLHVIAINLCLLTVCILFACFMPKIGTLIRYTGALSGMVYIFLLPSLLKIASLRKEGRLKWYQLVFNGFIPIIGSVNLISQFFINDQ